MKKMILPLLLASSFAYAQNKVTINVPGLSYNPAAVTVKVKDTVFFNITPVHPTVQVSQSTYAADGIDPISGGFSFTNAGFIIPTAPGTLYYVCTRHVDLGMKGMITVEALSTGIASTTLSKNGIQMYPNPATSHVQLTFGQATQVNSISVTNTMGNEVLAHSLHTSLSSYSLDVSNLKSGVYHVIISTPEKRMTEKIVVE